LRSGAFERRYRPPADEQRNTPQNAKATIDKPPWQWDASQRSCDQGKREDAYAGDKTEGDNPLVANRVDDGADEKHSNYQVRECKPVGAVDKKWIVVVGCEESLMNAVDPLEQMGVFRNRLNPTSVEKRIQEAKFSLKRESRNPADEQCSDEDRQPNANTTNVVSLGH